MSKDFELQLEVHEEAIELGNPDELERALNVNTWNECPHCSASKMDERKKKVLRFAGGSPIEYLDGRWCVVRNNGTVAVKKINGRNYTKKNFLYSMRSQRIAKRIWKDAGEVIHLPSRSIQPIPRKHIGPFKQHGSDMEVSDNRIVCLHHSETVFAVLEADSDKPSILKNSGTVRQEHQVCGHYRTLQSGRRTWVRGHRRNNRL
jgi:hypothetical protein